MLLDARADGEDVRIENNVFRRKTDFVHENSVGAFADADFLRVARGLAVFVKRHHDDRRAVFQNFRGAFAELRFAFLH